MPLHLIPICPDGMGNHECLDTSRKARGDCPVACWRTHARPGLRLAPGRSKPRGLARDRVRRCRTTPPTAGRCAGWSPPRPPRPPRRRSADHRPLRFRRPRGATRPPPWLIRSHPPPAATRPDTTPTIRTRC